MRTVKFLASASSALSLLQTYTRAHTINGRLSAICVVSSNDNPLAMYVEGLCVLSSSFLPTRLYSNTRDGSNPQQKPSLHFAFLLSCIVNSITLHTIIIDYQGYIWLSSSRGSGCQESSTIPHSLHTILSWRNDISSQDCYDRLSCQPS